MALNPPVDYERHSEYDHLINGDRDVNEDVPKQDPNVPTIPGVNLPVVMTARAAGIILAAADNTS